MKFVCIDQENKNESWNGSISQLRNFGSHYDIWIQSRSSINVIYGKTERGWFACMPDWNAGCSLIDINNRHWNKEKLAGIMGRVDRLTVEAALYALLNCDLKI
ncbi:MAG: hypothetical protein LBI03_10495 [Clostridiales bacterium]|nr:hypothetical protein [Clostridiales bacterium]